MNINTFYLPLFLPLDLFRRILKFLRAISLFLARPSFSSSFSNSQAQNGFQNSSEPQLFIYLLCTPSTALPSSLFLSQSFRKLRPGHQNFSESPLKHILSFYKFQGQNESENLSRSRLLRLFFSFSLPFSCLPFSYWNFQTSQEQNVF